MKKVTISIAVIVLVSIQPVWASLVGLGAAADYGLLGLENGTVIVNSANVVIADFGYSAWVTSTDNQKIGLAPDVWTGTAYVHSTATFAYTDKNYIPSGGIITNAAEDARLNQANNDALAASAAYSGLSADIVLGVLGDNDNRTVTAVGDVTVVSITSLNYNSDTLTFQGVSGYENVFIVNVGGDFQFSQSIISLIGTTSNKILFNFVDDSTIDIDINKSGTIWNGTILAPLGNVTYHNPATFNGAIIAKNINVHSDFNLNHTPFEIPEPATLALLGLGGLLLRKRKA